MTDFTPDFGEAAQGYEQAGGPLFLGLDPLLLVLLLALIAVAGAVGWALGRSPRREDDPDEVAKAIHARILAASRAALSAESDRLGREARALKKLVTELIGDAVALGSGVSGPLKAIQDALDHKRPAAKPAPGGAPAVTQTPIINVVVNPPPPAPPPPAGDLTGPEQTALLAAAVRQFHDHWSDRSERLRELKGARAQLSRKPPEEPHVAHGKGGHANDEHGDDHKDGHGPDDHGPAADPAADRRPIWERRKKSKKV